MIFERDPRDYSNHHVVEFNGDDIDPRELEAKISLNIDRMCETNVFLSFEESIETEPLTFPRDLNFQA